MEPHPVTARFTVISCPVCRSAGLHYLFSVAGFRIVRCGECGLMLTNPQPSNEELGRIYGEDYFLVEKNEAGQRHVDALKQGTADLYLDMLDRYGLPKNARLLEIGCGQGDFLACALARGMDVTGVEYSEHAGGIARGKLGGKGRVLKGEIGDVKPSDGPFDVIALSDVIEHVRDPVAFLDSAHALLKPDGVIFIATPTQDSWSARLLRNRWMEFKPEHLWYFNSATLQTLLIQRGFANIVYKPCVKTLSFDYIAGHFERYPVKGITPLTNSLRGIVPFGLRRRPINVVASGMVLIARRQERTGAPPRLSLIVPVYNEARTFVNAFEQILAKRIEGLEIEIIVVESNSTDGTRALVAQYEKHPRVKVIYEDRPSGKGHAVRTGLPHITGDYVLIQDADLEYDLEDYEALLDPLLQGRAAFVLGARHGGNAWKMRHFSDQPLQSAVLNCAHWFFALLIDVFCAVRLKDPFTMYKVFRRDCLSGLTFECDRFDFDWELVIKMVRKGYKPLEIPVNYRSRSFNEGKKVSFTRDPLTWLRALVKYRFCKLDTLDEAGRLYRAGRPSREATPA